jgi:hypothetical protein
MTLTARSVSETAETLKRQARITGLRQLADFLEAHPNLPVPYSGSQNVFVYGRDALAAVAREPGVRWQKRVADSYYALVVEFAGDYSYEVNVDREQVCRKVVTGSQIVPAQPEREEETFIWECDEPLLAGAQ